MAKYTQLEKKDIDKINGYYDLKISNFTPMLGGAGNSSFLFETQSEKYVATVCDEKSFEDVEKLSKLLQFLESNGFPTTRIISPPDNKNSVLLISNKPVIVKRYIPGMVIQKLSDDMLFQIGDRLARLHKISPPAYLGKIHPYGRQLFSSVAGMNIDVNFENWIEEKLVFLNQAIPENLPKALIHGDLFFDNILFKGKKLAAIIDFEEACNYYRVFDIGMGIVGLAVEDEEVNLDKAKNIVQGYQTISPLDEIEKEKLKLFIEYAAISTSYWRFCNYNIHHPNEELGNKHMEMVNIARKVNRIPTEILLNKLI